MFKKLKEKWKKQAEKVERNDIDYIRRYPGRWRIMMASVIAIVCAISCIMVIIDLSAIMFVICIIPGFLIFEYISYKKYKKAFPKS